MEEERSNQPNYKEINNAKYQNPKFVYDGKRMRVLTSRRTLDYASAYVYNQYFPNKLDMSFTNKSFLNIEPELNKKYINKSQLIYMKQPFYCNANEAINSKFAHISINKIKCPINVIKYSPDGRRLITGTATGEFTLWNGFSFNFETILQAHESPIRSLCWSPSGRFLVSGDALGLIKFWHPSMLNILKISAHTEPVRDVSFSNFDSKFLTASDDGCIKIWDSRESREEGQLKGHGWDVRVAQWHPEYSLIASGGKDNLVKMWDPREKKELSTIHLHRNTILALKWSKCGKYLLSGGKDQVVKMFDLRKFTEALSYKGHRKEITALCIHPLIDDIFVTGGAEGGLYFWQIFNNQLLKVVEHAHENTIWGIDYHPLGHVLATGAIDNSTRFWVRDRPKQIVETYMPPNRNVEIPGLRLIN